MAVRYNKLWKLLVDRKMSKADLRRAADISSNTLTKLSGSEFLKLRTRCGTTILRFYISLLITI